jgi:hypothetical protein
MYASLRVHLPGLPQRLLANPHSGRLRTRQNCLSVLWEQQRGASSGAARAEGKEELLARPGSRIPRWPDSRQEYQSRVRGHNALENAVDVDEPVVDAIENCPVGIGRCLHFAHARR